MNAWGGGSLVSTICLTSTCDGGGSCGKVGRFLRFGRKSIGVGKETEENEKYDTYSHHFLLSSSRPPFAGLSSPRHITGQSGTSFVKKRIEDYCYWPRAIGDSR
ncbi:hypothetical protein VNO80_01171 [Phaseolus coccineus]|uniref:Uncharacterized protein n=1 Tax=Phaseolus coccineus TaxID=3886 RepID=A0AAN9NZJ2_PHACN